MGGMAEREMESYTALVGPKQDTLNKHWKQDKSSFGYRMLMKMGWSEGKGLGKTLQGSNTHIKVAKKSDSAGLGSVQDDHGNLGWSVASASFDSVLTQLNARYGGAPPKAEKEGKKSKKKKKKRKGEASGDASEEEEEEGDGLQSVLLRHPKLLKSKNIKAYSAHDLSAILGVKRAETPSAADARKSVPAPAAEEESVAADAGGKRKKKKKRRRKEEQEEQEATRADEDSGEEEGDERVTKKTKKDKKGKKRRKGLEEEEEEQEQEQEQVEKKARKKKKQKRKEKE